VFRDGKTWKKADLHKTQERTNKKYSPVNLPFAGKDTGSDWLQGETVQDVEACMI